MPAGETTQLAEVLYLLKKLEGAVIPEGLKEKIDVMLKRLRRMARQGQLAGEYEATAKYIDWVLAVPWGKTTTDNLNLDNAKKIMDERHYAHDDVKERILEYLAIIQRKLSVGQKMYNAPVLAFVGVQGAGKTTLAKAIAESLGRSFYRISLGGLGDASELRGVPYSAVSAQPGQIVRALAQTKSMNPVILLDEFDKVSGHDAVRKDYMAILLEILDPQQNQTFRDLYIDYPLDLSKIIFIATANSFKPLSRELLDRLEIISFPDYTLPEKEAIAKKFLYPTILQYAGLRPEELQVADDAWPILTQAFATDQGVRRLERNLQMVARKAIKQIVTGKIKAAYIDAGVARALAQQVLPSIDEVQEVDYTTKQSA